MHVFGLTGGIASGKSTVAARLRARGVPVIDADELSRDAVAKGSPGLALIVGAFGESIVEHDGGLDRRKLASIVFDDGAKRRVLNDIIHPIVARLALGRAAEHRESGHKLACYEAALLVENGLADACRPLVVVSAPESMQLARAVARGDKGTSVASREDQARARMRAQAPLEQKLKAADFVIANDSSLASLASRTDAVLTLICDRLGIDERTATKDGAARR